MKERKIEDNKKEKVKEEEKRVGTFVNEIKGKKKLTRALKNIIKYKDKELLANDKKKEIKISIEDRLTNKKAGGIKDKSVNKNRLSINNKKSEPKANEISNEKKECNDIDCHMHGKLKVRGRIFKGKVIRKFHKRIVIEFERMVYIRKYERYAKSRTKIHARLPICMDDKISIGDYVKIQECRPLSKLIHFVVIEKIKGEAEKAGGGK